MAILKAKPTSAGRRFVVQVSNPDLHKGEPHAWRRDAPGKGVSWQGTSTACLLVRWRGRGIYGRGWYADVWVVKVRAPGRRGTALGEMQGRVPAGQADRFLGGGKGGLL